MGLFSAHRYNYPLMDKPGRILALPVYIKKERPIVSSKIGSFSAPYATKIDIDDVFGGRSLCALDYLPTANEGRCLIPTHAIYLVKRGVLSSDDG